MMFMGFSGLGSFNSDYSAGNCARVAPSTDGTSIECIDASGNVLSSTPMGNTGGAGAGTSTTPNNDSNQSWWSTALRSLVAGAAQGMTTNQTPVPQTIPAVATPWYQTPVGIIGIALGVLGLGFLVFKK